IKSHADKSYVDNRFVEAVILYTAGLNMSPSREEAATLYCNRAAAHSALGDHKETVIDCTEALHLRPKYPRAQLRIARAYRALNDWARAVEFYNEYTTSASATEPAEFQNRMDAMFESSQCRSELARQARDKDEAAHRAEMTKLLEKMRAENSERQRRWEEEYTSSKAGSSGSIDEGAMHQAAAHRATLGVSDTALPSEITKAYRKLALVHHPDRSSAPDAVAMFQSINEAYDSLKQGFYT
ncbi:unnamed protein product, partial [Phaeothamnion confervicola]